MTEERYSTSRVSEMDISDRYSWMCPNIDRVGAETVLRDFGESGSFLVRPSTTQNRSFALSVHEGEKMRHYIITTKIQNGVTEFEMGVQDKTPFPSIEALLQHYHNTPAKLVALARPIGIRYFIKESVKEVVKITYSEADDPNYINTIQEEEPEEMEEADAGEKLPAGTIVTLLEEAGDVWVLQPIDSDATLTLPKDKLEVYTRVAYDRYFGARREDITSSIERAEPPVLPANKGNLNQPLLQSRQSRTTIIPTVHAIGVAITDRNPNFFNKDHLRFRKGDQLRIIEYHLTGWAKARLILSDAERSKLDDSFQPEGLIPVHGYLRFDESKEMK